VDPVWIFVIVAAVILLFVLPVWSLRVDARRVIALEQWAADNGWSFSRSAEDDPSWAGWSAGLVNTALRPILSSELLRADSVGPVLYGVVRGVPVSVAIVRWAVETDPETGGGPAESGSLLVAVRLPAALSGLSVQPRWEFPLPESGDPFGRRFRVVPEDGYSQLPAALIQAHLNREVAPWVIRDDHLVTIGGYAVYQRVTPPEAVLPAAERALRTARLLTGQPPAAANTGLDR
jgi:hypothetical protein